MNTQANPAAVKTIRVAFGSVPKDGGTFTFYRNMRPALAARGIEMFCVTAGLPQNRLTEPRYLDEGCVSLVPQSRSIRQQAKAFCAWCEESDIDIAIAINSEGILSALPHLPSRIRVVARAANAFDQGYRVTMAGAERLAQIVALTPRLRDDLIRDYGADPEKITLIPNGIREAPFRAAAARARGQSERLEIGFLGRLEHGQKGVMYLPEIVAALKTHEIPFRLRIAGKGADAEKLQSALAAEVADGLVEFLGALGPTEVPEFLGSCDTYLFTSHFEGCPNALLEAMMAGAVPVSGIIDGITDYLIEPGRTGFLCELGTPEPFAAALADLWSDRARLQQLSRDVAAEARARFTDEIAADSYARVFREVMELPAPEFEPRPWSAFEPDPNFPGYWKHWIPQSVKSRVKAVMR